VNVIEITGLNAGIQFIRSIRIETIRKKELELTAILAGVMNVNYYFPLTTIIFPVSPC